MGKPVEMNELQVLRVIELLRLYLREVIGKELDLDVDGFINWLESRPQVK
jgi:hypothetical protein